jgi:hypothetical protein
MINDLRLQFVLKLASLTSGLSGFTTSQSWSALLASEVILVLDLGKTRH